MTFLLLEKVKTFSLEPPSIELKAWRSVNVWKKWTSQQVCQWAHLSAPMRFDGWKRRRRWVPKHTPWISNPKLVLISSRNFFITWDIAWNPLITSFVQLQRATNLLLRNQRFIVALKSNFLFYSDEQTKVVLPGGLQSLRTTTSLGKFPFYLPLWNTTKFSGKNKLGTISCTQ